MCTAVIFNSCLTITLFCYHRACSEVVEVKNTNPSYCCFQLRLSVCGCEVCMFSVICMWIGLTSITVFFCDHTAKRLD